MTFCTVVILVALVISASSLTGILQRVYGSLCHLPAMPSLNDSLVQPISPIILHRCYIRALRLLSAVCLGLWLSPAHCWRLHPSRAKLWPS